MAQEGEVDLPELLKQLEGPDNKEVEVTSEAGPDPGESDHPVGLDLHICDMGAIGLCECGGLGGSGRAPSLTLESDASGVRHRLCHLL